MARELTLHPVGPWLEGPRITQELRADYPKGRLYKCKRSCNNMVMSNKQRMKAGVCQSYYQSKATFFYITQN